MSIRYEITGASIAGLIAKKVRVDARLNLVLEQIPGSSDWRISGTGWRPLDALSAGSPSELLRALAIILESPADKGAPGSPGPQLLPR